MTYNCRNMEGGLFVKQIVAVHDLSGLGRCSLAVVMPVLAALGVRACPLPTAALSAHTAFPPVGELVFTDLTHQMEGILAHWKALGAEFDGFYSGFLGSPEQMDILARHLPALRRPGFLAMVDPVMGDNGHTYRTYTAEMCEKMAELAAQADIITPNLTEAAILLGEDYDPRPDAAKVSDWLHRLSLDGRRSVIVTGVSAAPGQTGAACLERATGETHIAQAPEAAGCFSGTGDLFAAVAFGKLLSGAAPADACDVAAEFVSRASQATLDRGGNPVEGADFEPLLGLLTR